MSDLPEFVVNPFKIDLPGLRTVTEVACPRSGCGTSFLVDLLPWSQIPPVQGRDGSPLVWPVGRPCPYCSRVSAIPAECRNQLPF